MNAGCVCSAAARRRAGRSVVKGCWNAPHAAASPVCNAAAAHSIDAPPQHVRTWCNERDASTDSSAATQRSAARAAPQRRAPRRLKRRSGATSSTAHERTVFLLCAAATILASCCSASFSACVLRCVRGGGGGGVQKSCFRSPPRPRPQSSKQPTPLRATVVLTERLQRSRIQAGGLLEVYGLREEDD